MKNYIPLKVEFCLYENILCGRILQQDDRLIEQVNKYDILEDNNLYRLCIYSIPELYNDILYLRGKDKDANNTTFCYSYDNKQDAKNALKNFKELIRQVNECYYEEEVVEKKDTYFVEVCE